MTMTETKNNRIRVALLVSCELEKEGLCRVINAHSDMTSCCQWVVRDSDEILNMFPRDAVDVAVIMLPWTILGDLLMTFHQKFPNTAMVVVSKEPFYGNGIIRMLDYGVVGLTCSMRASVIVSMIRLAYYHVGSIDIEMAKDIVAELQATGYSRRNALSLLDYKIWSLIVRGYSNPQIAKHCGISLSQTKHRIHHIFRYLGVNNRASAIAMYDRYSSFNILLDMGLESTNKSQETEMLLVDKKCETKKTPRESSS